MTNRGHPTCLGGGEHLATVHRYLFGFGETLQCRFEGEKQDVRR